MIPIYPNDRLLLIPVNTYQQAFSVIEYSFATGRRAVLSKSQHLQKRARKSMYCIANLKMKVPKGSFRVKNPSKYPVTLMRAAPTTIDCLHLSVLMVQ